MKKEDDIACDELEEIIINVVDCEGNVIDTQSIATIQKHLQRQKKQYLDKSLLDEFRNTIISTNIFYKTARLKEKYNLICVVMDRLESAIAYLNKHQKQLVSEESFICFLVYACMVRDGILKLYENAFSRKPSFVYEKKYFAKVQIYGEDAFDENDCPTDDVFFEYLRAMVFAHPFETSKGRRSRPFMEDGETQYCPWVIAREGLVGIRVYTSSDKFAIRDLTFSFQNLKAYIKSVYECLAEINAWAKDEIMIQDQEWAKQKIDRSGTVVDLIETIRKTCNDRFWEAYEIEDIETYLTCKTTNAQNDGIVKKYRKELIKILHQMCDALDMVDKRKFYETASFVVTRPRVAHADMHYQLEKIFCCLDDDHGWMDIEWGLKQVDDFAKEFAQKWVTIDTNTMSFDEIKLLVTIACYYEAKEQESVVE